MIYFTLYKIVNRLNGKIYIGAHQTQNPWDNYLGSGVLIKCAVEKYGKACFIKIIIGFFRSEKEMYDKEAEIVTEDFCKREDTYNITEGGCGGNTIAGKMGFIAYKNSFSNEEEYNLAQYKKGKSFQKRLKEIYGEDYTPFTQSRKKYGRDYHPLSGKFHTEETKQKIRISRIGKYLGRENPVYGKIWVNNGIDHKMVNPNEIPKDYVVGSLGVPHTKETKNKLSEMRRGAGNVAFGKRWITDGQKNKYHDPNMPLLEGWRFGKTLNQNGENNPTYGKVYITNGFDNKMISLNDEIPVGWRKGKTIKKK